MSGSDDDYNEVVKRSFWLGDLQHIVEQMSALKNVDVWDGEIVLASNNTVLGTLWYSTDVEEWVFDPARHGEEV